MFHAQNTPVLPVARTAQSGKDLRCPQQDCAATSVANFCTASLVPCSRQSSVTGISPSACRRLAKICSSGLTRPDQRPWSPLHQCICLSSFRISSCNLPQEFYVCSPIRSGRMINLVVGKLAKRARQQHLEHRHRVHRLAPGAGFAARVRPAPNPLTSRAELLRRHHGVNCDQRVPLGIQVRLAVRKIKNPSAPSPHRHCRFIGSQYCSVGRQGNC